MSGGVGTYLAPRCPPFLTPKFLRAVDVHPRHLDVSSGSEFAWRRSVWAAQDPKKKAGAASGKNPKAAAPAASTTFCYEL